MNRKDYYSDGRIYRGEQNDNYPVTTPHNFRDGEDVTGRYELRYQCPSCGGDGKETCNNPDHDFIQSMPGEVGRLGCPVCGHNEKHKVNDGKNICPECNGAGMLTPDIFQICAAEIGFDDEPSIIATTTSTPSEESARERGKGKHDFVKGYLCCVANLINMYGYSTEADELFKGCCYTEKQMEAMGIEESDIITLRPVVKEWQRRKSLSQ